MMRMLLPAVWVSGLMAAMTMASPPMPASTAPTSRPAEIAGVDKQDLFEARTNGYTTYRIPAIIVTGRGTLLVTCAARKLKGLDWDPIDVLMRRSVDRGRTWDAPQAIAIAPADAAPNPVSLAKHLWGNGVTLDNAVLIAGPEGTVHLLYCVNYNRCFYRRSNDDGKTFSEPREITAAFEKFGPEYDWKVIGTGPGHAIRLVAGGHAGRLVVPFWMSLGTGGNGHHPSCVGTVYSDDDGATWERGQIAVSSSADVPDPNETTAVERGDGVVMLNVRNESPRNRRVIVTSPDGATGWSKPAFDAALFDPICFASWVRLPETPANAGRTRLVFSNPDSSATHGKSIRKPRKNLTLRLSEDGGATWPTARVLEPGVAGYSDLAAAPDGTLYCFYERGGLKDMFDTGFLTLAHIPPGWLDSGAGAR